MIVTLEPHEAIFPASVGMRRQLDIITTKTKNWGVDDEGRRFDQDIFAAMAEFVVARTLNLFWAPTIRRARIPDVGGSVGVRCRFPLFSGSDLPIRQHDNDDVPHVLVHNRGDLAFELLGWLYARDGKARGVWNAPSNCFYVGPPYRTIEELRALIGYTPIQARAAE